MSSLAAIPWSTRTHQRVATRLDRLLADGLITDGHVLPPERELSLLCGVSRPTLRQVMQTLEAHGRVRSHARRGRVLVAEPTDTEDVSRSLSQMLVLVTDASAPTADTATPVPRGYAMQLVAAVTEAAVAEGFDLVVLRLDSAENTLPTLVREGVTGVVVAPAQLQHHDAGRSVAQVAHHLGVPVAAYGFRPDAADDATERASLAWDIVGSDHHAGGYLMTRWLLEKQGRRRPVPYLRVKSHVRDSGKLPAWWLQRLAGYRAAMEEAGLEPLEPLHVDAVWGDQAIGAEGHERDARYAAGYLAPYLREDQAPDAFLGASDYAAAVINRALDYVLDKDQTRPLVTGYDNTWTHLRSLNLTDRPPAATVDKDLDAIGQALIKRLQGRLHGDQGDGPHLVTPRLIVCDESFDASGDSQPVQ